MATRANGALRVWTHFTAGVRRARILVVLGLFAERGQSAVHLTAMNVLVLRALDAQNSSSYPLYCEPSKKPLYVDKM